MPRSILDCDLIKTLRLENKLSQRELADMIGVSQAIIRYLESGQNHEQQNLRTVAKLAEVLGADIRDLIPRDGGAADPASDDIRVEALLLGETTPLAVQEVGAAFGWPIRRARQALQRLRDRLVEGGSEVHEVGGDRWKIGPRRAVLADEDRQRLAHALLPRRGLNRLEAQLLREVADGMPAERFTSQSATERRSMAGLLKLGLVVFGEDGAPTLAASVERSLHL